MAAPYSSPLSHGILTIFNYLIYFNWITLIFFRQDSLYAQHISVNFLPDSKNKKGSFHC